jgi:hypothetical protein
MYTTRLSVLVEELEQWHQSVKEYAFCSDFGEYDETFDSQDFFGTIAAFVEFVLSTEELRDVFEALLSAGTDAIPAKRHIGSNAAQLMQSIYCYVTAEDKQSRRTLSRKIWYLSEAQGQLGKQVTRDLYLRLRSALTNRIAKRTVISRFKAYCELYKTTWLISELGKAENERRPEAFLQDFLEEYVFQQGYYPVSEAQLGRGRLDILVHKPGEASFLVEAKQVGFGSKDGDATIRDAINRIEQAMAQALTYKDRLADYASESDVYIVLFTPQYFVFEDEQPVKRGGLSFFVEVINLIDKPVTQWGAPEGLSVGKA